MTLTRIIPRGRRSSPRHGILLALLALYAGAVPAETCIQAYQRLIPEYDKAVAHAPGSPERMDAVIHTENSIFTALESCPDHPRLLALLAECEIAIGRYVFAEHYARRIVDTTPGYWRGHLVLGWVLTRSDRRDEGIRHLEQAVTLVPDNAAVRLNLCQAHIENGQTDLARRACAAAARAGEPGITAKAQELLKRLGP